MGADLNFPQHTPESALRFQGAPRATRPADSGPRVWFRPRPGTGTRCGNRLDNHRGFWARRAGRGLGNRCDGLSGGEADQHLRSDDGPWMQWPGVRVRRRSMPGGCRLRNVHARVLGTNPERRGLRGLLRAPRVRANDLGESELRGARRRRWLDVPVRSHYPDRLHRRPWQFDRTPRLLPPVDRPRHSCDDSFHANSVGGWSCGPGAGGMPGNSRRGWRRGRRGRRGSSAIAAVEQAVLRRLRMPSAARVR